MAEDITIVQGSKAEQYQSLLPQIRAVIADEEDLIANLANVCACLKQQFNWLWIGFYIVKEEQLVLGPFQGPLACTRINIGKGVCGTSWQQKQTLIVPDVNAFPGHIACSSLSVSEIVVPVIQHGLVVAVIDADSEQYNTFDETDRLYLEQLADCLPPFPRP